MENGPSSLSFLGTNINPLPDDKILASSILKGFAQDYFKVVPLVQFFLKRAGNNVEQEGHEGPGSLT